MLSQPDLFLAQALPRGLRYAEEFLDAEQEQELIAKFRALPFDQARYKQWTAKRRIVSYGGLAAAQPMPAFLLPARSRAADWAGVAPETLSHALVTEYRPGTELGWHRDVPEFSLVVAISLLGRARLKLRPYPAPAGVRGQWLDLEPRSIYVLSGEARWRWQHAISPTKALRYSLTFRALRA